MWPNSQFPVEFVTFTKKFLMENFIFCAVSLRFITKVTGQKNFENLSIPPVKEEEFVRRRLLVRSSSP